MALGERKQRGVMTPAKWANVGVRAVVEGGVVAALAYWGYETGVGTASRVVLTIGAPVVGFGIWGAVDFHRFGRLAEPLRLVEELVISGLAAVALFRVGQPVLGIALAALSVTHHALVYLTGERLVQAPAPSGGAIDRGGAR